MRDFVSESELAREVARGVPLPHLPASKPLTGRERLLVLADFLDNLPPEHFDISLYRCGTKACALGWCPTIFAGWRLEQDSSPIFGNESDPYASAQIFFGISFDVAWAFFSTSGNDDDTTAKQVASNIRAYLAEG